MAGGALHGARWESSSRSFPSRRAAGDATAAVTSGMPKNHPARSLAAACLVAVTLFGVAPRPVAALEPPRPLPDHRPTFVTETDTRPWIDCLWASAAMLADKWTNGDIRVTHGELRSLSGDGGGSSLEDLEVAFHKLRLDVPLDAQGDSSLTWGGLLERLRHGAGAVVLGDDSQLPRWYGRWDSQFWRKTGTEDNHAVYVERYDARRGRVWLMDPLARGAWKGEWIGIGSLRRFAWFTGGYVVAVTTPTARAAPFAGVVAERPRVGLSPAALTATWHLRAPSRWTYPGADPHVAIAPATDPIAAAIASADVGPLTTADAAPDAPIAAVAGRTLRLSAALPTEPGAYVASMSLTDRRFGARFVASAPVAVFVPGPRRATLRLNVNQQILNAGAGVKVNVSVANSGQTTWDETAAPVSDAPTPRERSTRVVATWVRLDAIGEEAAHADEKAADAARGAPAPVTGAVSTGAAGAATLEAAPLVVELRRVPLQIGHMIRIRETLRVPDEVGRWALVVDVVDDLDGSFAALGSAPAVALFEVVPPRGIEVVE